VVSVHDRDARLIRRGQTMSMASRKVQEVSAGSPERLTGRDSPVSVDGSSTSAPSIIRASAQDRSPSPTISTSPGTRSRAAISDLTPVTDDHGGGRQERGEGFDSPFSLHFLDERESGPEQDDSSHGDGESWCAADPGQDGGLGEQGRQRLGELGGQPSGPPPGRMTGSTRLGRRRSAGTRPPRQ
jgi:hypothetical protein